MAHCPYAAVYFTTSNGESDSPGNPPIVPLIPDILLINVKVKFFLWEQSYEKDAQQCVFLQYESFAVRWFILAGSFVELGLSADVFY